MTENSNHDNHAEDAPPPGPNWEDPAVAVGNAPPMATWPLVVSVLFWTGGIVFLLVMMTERLS